MTDNTDPHVKVIDDQAGIFAYNDLGEGKELRGIDIESVTDVEHQDAKDAYDEYEDISRYVLWTEEELAEQKERQEKTEKQTKFMEEGPDQLESNTVSIEDLTVLLSEMIGGAEE